MGTKLDYKLNTGELELLKLLCLPDKIICQRTGVNPITLRSRVERLRIKLGVENRISLVVKSLKLGLITTSELQFREW